MLRIAFSFLLLSKQMNIMITIQIGFPLKTTLVIIILSSWFHQFHSVCKMMSTPTIAWKIPEKTLIALHNWWLIILTCLSIIRERCLYYSVGRCCDGFMSVLWPLELVNHIVLTTLTQSIDVSTQNFGIFGILLLKVEIVRGKKIWNFSLKRKFKHI